MTEQEKSTEINRLKDAVEKLHALYKEGTTFIQKIDNKLSLTDSKKCEEWANRVMENLNFRKKIHFDAPPFREFWDILWGEYAYRYNTIKEVDDKMEGRIHLYRMEVLYNEVDKLTNDLHSYLNH